MQTEPSSTNWYVITGGPSSGKTTTVNLLKKLGYKTTIEHARHYIDTQMVVAAIVSFVGTKPWLVYRTIGDISNYKER